jgi:ElaB/YqjD/DUF883 family membrane-anchored ribosome-binding protein
LRQRLCHPGVLVYSRQTINRGNGDAMDNPEYGNQQELMFDLHQVIENAQQLLNNTEQSACMLCQATRVKLTEALQVAGAALTRCEDARLAWMIDTTRAANELFDDRTGEAKLLRSFQRQR